MQRRTVLVGATGVLADLTLPRARADIISEPAPEFRVLATGLKFPEGPIPRPDGSVILVEIARGTLSRAVADGSVEIIANLGGGPNGAAMGPDGACYVCNDGGLTFTEQPDGRITASPLLPANYVGGSIQRVDLRTGAFETLFTEVDGNPLRAPNDLVFDQQGGLWFTDTGKSESRTRDHGGVFWVSPDRSEIRQVVYPLVTPNGIALAPDRKTLYVALSMQRQLVSFEITGNGTLRMNGGRPVQTLVASLGGDLSLDSMAVEENGNIVIGTVRRGGLTTISADGASVTHMALPDFVVAHLAFGGPDMKTVYATFSSTGRLAVLKWPRPGLKLLYT